MVIGGAEKVWLRTEKPVFIKQESIKATTKVSAVSCCKVTITDVCVLGRDVHTVLGYL